MNRGDVNSNASLADINELMDRDRAQVDREIAEAKTFLSKKDLAVLEQIEGMLDGPSDSKPASSTPTKVYLNCPYDEKENCKRHGGRWDANRKQWYYEGDKLPEALEKYIGQGGSSSPSSRSYLRCRSCG